jgi:hypothetical protein
VTRGWRFFRTAAIAAAVAVGGAYLLLCWLFLLTVQVFVSTGGDPVAPRQAGLSGFAAVSVPTDDGERLSGWWRPPDPGHGAVLVLLGNGGMQLADLVSLFRD